MSRTTNRRRWTQMDAEPTGGIPASSHNGDKRSCYNLGMLRAPEPPEVFNKELSMLIRRKGSLDATGWLSVHPRNLRLRSSSSEKICVPVRNVSCLALAACYLDGRHCPSAPHYRAERGYPCA